jgi:hypothetical protein
MKIIFKIRTFCDANPHIKLAGLRVKVDERARGQAGKRRNTTNKPTSNF